MEDCCICHKEEATSPDGFFCEECSKRYEAIMVSQVILSEKREKIMKCESCQKEVATLHEVAGMELCSDCIAPPRDEEVIRWMYQSIVQAQEWMNRFGEHSPIQFGGEAEVARRLSNARKNAERQWPLAQEPEEVEDTNAGETRPGDGWPYEEDYRHGFTTD